MIAMYFARRHVLRIDRNPNTFGLKKFRALERVNLPYKNRISCRMRRENLKHKPRTVINKDQSYLQ